MRLFVAVAALLFCAGVLPARADKKLDEAVAKAEAQLAKGKEDEAVKILQKAAAQAPARRLGQLALAQLYARLGKLDEAGGRARQGGRARVLGVRQH